MKKLSIYLWSYSFYQVSKLNWINKVYINCRAMHSKHLHINPHCYITWLPPPWAVCCVSGGWWSGSSSPCWWARSARWRQGSARTLYAAFRTPYAPTQIRVPTHLQSITINQLLCILIRSIYIYITSLQTTSIKITILYQSLLLRVKSVHNF